MVNRQQKNKPLLLVVIGFISTIFLIKAGWGGTTAESYQILPFNNAPEGWTVECVDCLRYFTNMSGNSAALDSNGRIRTAYGGDGLYYATENPDGSYQTEVVDANPYRGLNATMVLDSSGRPHILYYAGDLLRLNYAHNDGVQWHLTSLPTANLTALPHPWLVIDGSNNLHVAFNNNGALFYGFHDQNTWQFTPVDSPALGNIGRPSLALDSSNRPHIVYAGGGKYAYHDGIGWQIITFPESFEYGENAAITVDENDSPHIVLQADFNNDEGQDLLYRFMDGDDWLWEVIDIAYLFYPLDTGYDISFVLDANNRPVVAYTSQFRSSTPYPWYYYYGLRISSWGPNGWEFYNYSDEWNSPLDDTHYSTLLPGSGSTFRIVYKTGNKLQSGIVDGSSNVNTIVDQGGSTGTHIHMAVDNEDRLHISTHEADYEQLRYGLRENEVWSVETVFVGAGFEGSDWTSLALTTDGRPFIVFDHYSRLGALPYTFFDGSDWVYDENDQYDSYNFNIGMDSGNNVHIALMEPYCCTYGLVHLVRDPSGNWSELIEVDAGIIPGQLDITLDTADLPHIAYPAADGLRYAVQTPAGWLTQTLAPGEADYASIALDRYNRPHIAWYDTVEQSLRYAAFNGSDWQVKTLDSSGSVGQYPSLAVDRLGRVYIAYYDASNQDLKYATYDNITWTITTLLSEGDVGSYSKLVMPYAGYPAIAYYDATARDLMLIYRPFQPENFVYLPFFLTTNP